jgi:hypothetical protein
MIVRGMVGEPTSYMSEDQRSVYTDYPIKNLSILYTEVVTETKQPGLPALAVTILGGAISLGWFGIPARNLNR